MSGASVRTTGTSKVQRHPFVHLHVLVVKAFKGINHKGHEGTQRKRVESTQRLQ